jgi:DNA-binding MarR family transcriptional regulator
MTLTLDRLERAGWVRRLPDPDDRRRIVVEATAAGLAVAVAVNDELHRWESSLGASAAQRRRLGAALAELTALIEAHPADP